MLKIRRIMRPLRIIYSAIRRFFIDQFPSRVSALTFSLLLAIIPYLLVSMFFFAHFPALVEMVVVGRGYILEHFIPSSAIIIEKYFYGFIQQAKGLSAINLLFLIFSVTMMVSTIEETLNHVWMVPNRSNFSMVFVLNWFFILLLPFIIGLSVFLSSYLLNTSWISYTIHFFGIYNLLSAIIPFLINTSIFSLIYVLIPNARITWREGFSCGILAAILFEIARLSFEFYVTQLANYSLVYGFFAFIPIFLLWLYIFWAIIIFSAILVQEIKQFDALEKMTS